jgi:hypothetical protein
MTLAVTHPFTCAIADDPTAVAAGEVVPSNWNANHALAGVADVSQGGTGNATWTAGQILYASGTTTLTQSANLAWDITNSNLIIGGAPTGAATTDKLQVSGDALVSGLRVSNAAITAVGATSSVTIDVQSVSSGVANGITIRGGTTSVSSNSGGWLTFSSGSGTPATNTSGGMLSFTGGTAYGTGIGGGFTLSGGINSGGANSGGLVLIRGGNVMSGSTGAGGNLTLAGGGQVLNGSAGKGGDITLTGGTPGTGNNGGAISLTGGTTTTGTAGTTTLKGGAASSTGTAGSVVIAPGASTSGTAGTVSIKDASLNTLIQVGTTANTLGIFGATPIVKPTVTGAKIDLTATGALASLLTQLATLGLIIDSST